jgi:hypothetical protein
VLELAFVRADICSMSGDDCSLAVEKALSQGQLNCDCSVQMAQKLALENVRQMRGISEIHLLVLPEVKRRGLNHKLEG